MQDFHRVRADIEEDQIVAVDSATQAESRYMRPVDRSEALCQSRCKRCEFTDERRSANGIVVGYEIDDLLEVMLGFAR